MRGLEGFNDVSTPVYILVMLFGISSWIDINAVFVELPLMVPVLPEGWALPSYIVLIIQIANIGPLTYVVMRQLLPDKVKEWPVIYVILFIGATSCCLLIFFWDYTSYIGGEERSTGLLSLTGCLALVDCTSSVVYLPYMAYFKEQYLSAFYIGEGLSGLIPGLLGLAQGVGEEPTCVNVSLSENGTEWGLQPEYSEARFSVEVFYACIFMLICISGIAFTFLHFANFCQVEKLGNSYVCDASSSRQTLYFDTHNNGDIELSPKAFIITGTYTGQQSDKPDIAKESISLKAEIPLTKIGRYQFVLLMVYLGFVNAMTNGILPSTLSYSCLPYGNKAYGLATRLSAIANPLACFLALFVPRVSIVLLSLIVGVGAFMCSYQMYLAALSPEPPLQDEIIGVVLVVLSYFILIALFSYTKVVIATICCDSGGRIALIWCGGITQIGSFCGAIVSFICVNILELLESEEICPE